MEVEAPSQPVDDLRTRDVDDQLGEWYSGFVRKVFALIGTQIGLTIAVVTYVMSNADLEDFLVENPVYLVPSLVIFAVTALLPACYPQAGRKVPFNYVLLYTFVASRQTLSAATLVAYPCIQVGSDVALTAAILAVVVTLALILSVIAVLPSQCVSNFQVSTSVLYLILATSVVWFILAVFAPGSGWMNTGLCALGALVFGIYIAVDVAMLMESSKYHLSNDDYVLAAIVIYLDILNLFLRILQIVAKLKGSQTNPS